MSEIANVALTSAFRIERTYDSSGDFMDKVGQYVERRGTFLPMRKELEKGTMLELGLTLPSGRDIIRGKARVIKFQEATGTKPTGVWIKWEKLSPRSQENIRLVETWRTENT